MGMKAVILAGVLGTRLKGGAACPRDVFRSEMIIYPLES